MADRDEDTDTGPQVAQAPMPGHGLPPFGAPGYGNIYSAVVGGSYPNLPPGMNNVLPIPPNPRQPIAPPSAFMVGNMPGGVSTRGLPPLYDPKRVPFPTPPTAPQHDPIRAMGNPLTAMALIGSMFVRQPATAAMRALAAATKASINNDQQTYQNKRAEFQDKLQEAIREQQQENDDYTRSYNNRQLAYTERLAEMRATATARGDSGMLAGLDKGGTFDPESYIKSRKTASDAALQTAAVLDIMERSRKEGKPIDFNTAYQMVVHGKSEAKTQGELPAKRELLEAKHTNDMEKLERTWDRKDHDTQVRTEARMDEAIARNATAKEIAKIRSDGAEERARIKAQRDKELAEFKANANKELQEQKAKENLERDREKAKLKAPAGGGIPMSPNMRVREMQKRDSVEESLRMIDANIAILEKKRLAAGAGGWALRLKERVENVFGAKDTDREQFMRNTQYLRMKFPQVTGSGARPLAIDARRVEDYIGGISMGDTTANVIRSLQELRGLYVRQLQHSNRDLGLSTESAPTSAAPAPATPPPAGPGSGPPPGWAVPSPD